MSETLCHCRGCDVARLQGAEEVKQRVRDLAYKLRIDHCNDELGRDWACFVSAEIIKALDGEQ